MTLSWTLQGPPFLNGSLHVGHGVNIIIKDFTLRFQKQILNQSAPWYYNFDCHGLPIEREVEKIIKPGDSFIDKCLELNDKFLEEGIETLNRLNLLHLVTKENILCTNEIKYKVKLMNFISELFEQKKLYLDLKHIPYCYNCNSPLANAEIEKKEIEENIYLICAEIIDKKYKSYKLIFATTELETVLQNKAICLNPNHKYGLKNKTISGVIEPEFILGSQLEGMKYKIYTTEKQIVGTILCSELIHSSQFSEKSILSTYASVGLSPWGSELDYNLILKNNILTKKEIDSECENQRIERTIIVKNKKQIPYVQLLKRKCLHEVCWRCNNKIAYTLTEQWFLNINSAERDLLSNVKFIGSNDKNVLNETHKFFSNPVNWNISRYRVFGTPLPILKCDCGNLKSILYEEEDFKSRNECYYPMLNTVLERKNIDLSCFCGKKYAPIQNSLDVWLDSGFLPLYFDLKEPYAVLIEGVDQKRGWFYSTAVLSVMSSFKNLPYKNLYYTGWILNNARKISKSNNTLGTLKELLDNTEILNLRSYAITNANSSDTEYSLDLVNQEKKYVNAIINAKKFLNNRIFQNDLKVNVQLFKNELLKLKELQDYLNLCFFNNQYDKYWITLKNHFLQVYSRDYINTYKKNTSMEEACFLKEYGCRLFKYIYPVLGISLS